MTVANIHALKEFLARKPVGQTSKIANSMKNITINIYFRPFQDLPWQTLNTCEDKHFVCIRGFNTLIGMVIKYFKGVESVFNIPRSIASCIFKRQLANSS